MATPQISEDLLRHTCDLVATHGSISAAAAASGISRHTLQSRYQRARQLADKYALTVPRVVPHVMTAARAPLPHSADEAWRHLDRAIGRSARVLEVPEAPGGPHERIVIAGDLHAPFHDVDAVADLVAREGGRGSTLIINGDLQDWYAISRFTKYERVAIESELAAVDALLGTFAQAFARVVIVTGNHDRPRFERQLRQVLSQELLEIVQFLTNGTLDPIGAIARRYPNVSLAEHTVGRYAVRWLYQHGDLLCAHAEKFSRMPGSALRGVYEWFAERREVLGLEPWRVLIQAHTHQYAIVPWMADVLLVEGGCLCQTAGYQLDAKIAGRPQRRGYVVVDQYRGRSDINSLRFVSWDWREDRTDDVAGTRRRTGDRHHGSGATRKRRTRASVSAACAGG